MLFYAANMSQDGANSGDEARTHPYLAKYVGGWGRAGDLGLIAEGEAEQPLGAAWVRLLSGAEKNYPAVADDIPELAIAVLPQHIGQGIGALLLARLLDDARAIYPAVVLSVRAAEPRPAALRAARLCRRRYGRQPGGRRVGGDAADVVGIGGWRALAALTPVAAATPLSQARERG